MAVGEHGVTLPAHDNPGAKYFLLPLFSNMPKKNISNNGWDK